jgi:hypothetical protein
MKDIEGYAIPDKVLQVVTNDETLTCVFQPSYATARLGQTWSRPHVLLTSDRLVIVKDRLFGRARADVVVDWADVSGVTGQLWMGGGPKIQLLVSGPRLSPPIELIVPPEFAVDAESAIRSCYLR